MSALISVGKQCPHGSEERHKYVRMVNSMMASYKTIAERWDAAATTLYKEMMVSMLPSHRALQSSGLRCCGWGKASICLTRGVYKCVKLQACSY